MIQNPKVEAFQYDPYAKKLTREKYGFDVMVKNRKLAIDTAQKAQRFGLIQGTLGRQGNMKIFEVFWFLKKNLFFRISKRN